MKSKLLKSFLSSLILSSAIMSAAAAEEMNQTYVFIEAGLSKPSKAKGTYPVSKNFKNSANFGGGIGYRINENFRTDLSFNFRPNFKYHSSLSAAESDSGIATNFAQKVKSYNGMLNVYYDIGEFSNMFKPYVTGGVGIAKNKAGNLTADDGATIITKFGKSKTNFAWQLGAGSLVKIADNTHLNFGYRFVNLGKVSTKTNYVSNSATIHGDDSTPTKTKLAAHEFVAGVTFSF